jgi:hypothetical protein
VNSLRTLYRITHLVACAITLTIFSIVNPVLDLDCRPASHLRVHRLPVGCPNWFTLLRPLRFVDHGFKRKFGIARCYPSPSTDADAARCANPINAMCRHGIFELAAATGYDVLATKLLEKLGRRPREIRFVDDAMAPANDLA